ncbi:MarR family winged helix-turn-helix transcriptional regulator [Ktedonobacter racemifer]|uniref:MarR family winged helix-turn-helix transcriptional regulator n=1 Tax=Ktedonobacter racemifer TaxID=363277 RepID=UPI003B75B58F
MIILSRDLQGKSPETLARLTRELRQCYGLGASFFRAAATRIEMTDTDIQVLDLLENGGEASAGQLADLMGLTTGTFTGILNRLEKAGLIQRTRDPNDGRRVLVQLASDTDSRHNRGPLFDALGKAWEDLASHYDEEQLAFLLAFLQRSNEIARQEIARLREAPEGEGGIFSAPLEAHAHGRLVFASGITRLFVRADDNSATLYQARFEGPAPNVKTKDGVVTIRYPRYLGVVDWRQRASEVSLNVAIPWQIVVQGGAADITAELGGLDLVGLEVKGGLSSIHLELPVPSRVVPIQISGGATVVTIRRPGGVAARVHLKGWVSELRFDDQTFSHVGNDVRLQSSDMDPTAPCYDIDVAGSASNVTITAG